MNHSKFINSFLLPQYKPDMIFKVIDYGSKNNRISSKMQFFTAVLFSIFLSLGYQCKPQSIKIDSLVACAGDTALISIAKYIGYSRRR